MAALGKIRSRGVILICVVGFALFAFIAEELFRSCNSISNENRQQIGEVLGNKISVQDYQKLVDEYSNVVKISQGRDNLTDEELNQVKDMVWNNFIQFEIISAEADKLGLTVTDEELQDILNQGTNPMLLQTPFVNPQTGLFDANLLKNFLADYKKASSTRDSQYREQYQNLYIYWTFIEKSLLQQLLIQKYQTLLGACILSNPISAKMAYDNENQESNIELAAFPYSSINDKEVKYSESDIKAKYEELKKGFLQPEETRSIKYVDVKVTPSASDRKALDKDVSEYIQTLAATDNPTEIVRQSGSLITFLGIPQTKAAFPSDISTRLDSVNVGGVYGPVENKQDNTINIIKLISKSQLPDSVQFRAIQVMAETPEAAAKSADSIYTALRSGADFETVAKNYSQTGESNWITSSQYQNSPTMDADTKTYIDALNNLGVNEIKNVQLTQGNIVIQVLDRKGLTTKYVAAVIKKPIDFSKDTYSQAYNKFSEFVSKSQSLSDLEKNAEKSGYQVRELADIQNTAHYISGIHGTRDALKWLFTAKNNEISPLYECGDNDHLLVIALTGINKKGYRSLDDEYVKNFIKDAVIRDKKADMLLSKVSGVKDMKAAEKDSAKISQVEQITFSAPVFVQTTGASEPALSGAVSATPKGKFSSSAVKGNAGVYLFKVDSKSTRDVKYDENDYEQRAKQTALQYASGFSQDLYLKANVKDNRYLFF